MNTLDDFFNNAKSRDLCERGAKIWEHCKSKKALMDFALGSWGADYVCTAIMSGWGVSPEVIARDFAPFNNGRYTRDKDGYTSRMYCLTDADEIVINSTLSIIIGYNGVIRIPKYRFCELYLCNCNVEIVGEETALCNLYNSRITNIGNTPAKIQKDIHA